MAGQFSASGSGSAVRSGASRRLPLGIIFALLIAVAGIIAWKLWPLRLPPTNDTLAVAKLVNSSHFAKLPESKKRQYINALRGAGETLASGLSGGKITQEQYDVAMSYAWLARQLDHMEEYFQLPAGAQREKYLEERAQKARKAPPPTTPAIKNEKLRDKVVEQWMIDWPADRRAQWEEYRKASKSKKAGP